MKLIAAPILLVFLFVLITPLWIHAQEENTAAIIQGNRYISFKLKAIDKYNSRIERQQKELLNKLKRKEKHFAHKLKSSDSLAYAKYKEQRTPSYDSISKLSHADTGSTAANFSKNRNATVDSLRGIQSFVQSKSGLPGNGSQVPGSSTAELNNVQGKINFQNYINQLITQRTNSLKSVAGSESNVPGLTGIEKQVYYSKAKMKVFKDMQEDPSKAEDKAMEYLQGSQGFDKSMNSATQLGSGNMQALAGSGGGASQLMQMGYQTKSQMQTNLQKNFGSNLGSVSKEITGALSQWSDAQKNLATLKDTKQSLQQLRAAGKPTFKVNPMRGLPFWKRIQKQYSWQTTRPSSDGTQPAMATPSVMLGYRQSPKLICGVGFAATFGLGQSWSDISFSFRGVGYRTFATWAWQYGIGLYSGYERMYDGFAFSKNQQQPSSDGNMSAHSNGNYTESLLVGLTKKYNINNKYSGQMQLLYDIWWQQKGLQSPFVLRLTTVSK